MAEKTDPIPLGLHAIPPEGPLYRIGRPLVLYASSSRLGAFVEVLARFRPDPQILAEFKEIEDDDGRVARAPGELDVGWLRGRCIGVARVAGVCSSVRDFGPEG